MIIPDIKNSRYAKFQLGTWLSLGSPVIAELASLCGFDWLLIDLEHGAVGESALFQTLQALRSSSATVIVRIGAPQHDLIQRVLDWGADGIMIPHVDTAAIAVDCVKATRYPPHGTRGYSRSVRACDYGLRRNATDNHPLVFAQIESAQAIANVDAIAATEGVDVLFVGPADLKLDIKASDSVITYEESLKKVAHAAVANQCSAGILVRDVMDAGMLLEQGFLMQAVESDLSILRDRYQQLVERFSKSEIL